MQMQEPGCSQQDRLRQEKKALNAALYALGRADKSHAAMAQMLARKGFDEQVIHSVCEKLIRLGYLNDLRFAQNLVRTVQAGGGGQYKLAQKLAAKGIDKQCAQQAMQELDEQTEYENALALANKLIHKLKPENKKQTLYRRLAAKGFAYDTIGRVMQDCDLTLE